MLGKRRRGSAAPVYRYVQAASGGCRERARAGQGETVGVVGYGDGNGARHRAECARVMIQRVAEGRTDGASDEESNTQARAGKTRPG